MVLNEIVANYFFWSTWKHSELAHGQNVLQIYQVNLDPKMGWWEGGGCREVCPTFESRTTLQHRRTTNAHLNQVLFDLRANICNSLFRDISQTLDSEKHASFLRMCETKRSEDTTPFSQKIKTYKMGLGVCVCVSVENFGPPNNLQTCYPIYTKFFPYIQDGRQISAIIVTEDYLCYKDPKSL